MHLICNINDIYAFAANILTAIDHHHIQLARNFFMRVNSTAFFKSQTIQGLYETSKNYMSKLHSHHMSKISSI